MITLSTVAPGDPVQSQPQNLATAVCGPATTASTLPSGKFLTHPSSPSRCASRLAVARYQTPCTRPATRQRTVRTSDGFNLGGVALSCGLTGLEG